MKIKQIIIVALVVFICHICLMFIFVNFENTNRRYVIIDTDAGGDDAVAIFLALAAESQDSNINIVAITCTYGNTDEKNVETNILKILTVANQANIPVYAGAKLPINGNYTVGDYFGKDGFGDFSFNRQIIGSINYRKYAAVAMIEGAQKYSGKLSIVALGPLTNIVLAASLDPCFLKNVEQFYVMGSTINFSNETKNLEVEFNIGLDAESADRFLNSRTTKPITILPWDTVKNHPISKVWRQTILGSINSKAINILNSIERIPLSNNNTEWWLPADSIAIAAMIWPELALKSELALAKVIVCGSNKGAVIMDFNNNEYTGNNVNIITSINVTMYKDLLLHYLAKI